MEAIGEKSKALNFAFRAFISGKSMKNAFEIYGIEFKPFDCFSKISFKTMTILRKNKKVVFQKAGVLNSSDFIRLQKLILKAVESFPQKK